MTEAVIAMQEEAEEPVDPRLRDDEPFIWSEIKKDA